MPTIRPTIRLYNSKTRRKEDFRPLDDQNVRLYVCGPTVYDRAHLGNARPVVVFDTLFRLLRHVYGADHVTYVRNFTDVDDKINATALARQKAGAKGTLEELIAERTEETIGWYHADMDALGALRPTHEPCATAYIGPMIAMIETLIARGHAYAKDGHVLFRVRSYAAYGALSGRSVDDMIAGARVEVAPFKEDPMDFVLWKPSDAETPGWDSPWGRGRPGWHIECSAMSYELLGASFDIHGGGIDLQFPHHENELAQSCCAHPEAGFASVWMHNEMLQVEGKKMSKSLGNFFTVRDLLKSTSESMEFHPRNGSEVRLALLLSHYREPMDYSVSRRNQARTILNGFCNFIGQDGVEGLSIKTRGVAPFKEVVDALADDLDTPKAIEFLNSKELMLRYSYLSRDELRARIYVSQRLLGFDVKKLKRTWDIAFNRSDLSQAETVKYMIRRKKMSAYLPKVRMLLAKSRAEAIEKKDFRKIDSFKEYLEKIGVEVRFSGKDAELIRATTRPVRLKRFLQFVKELEEKHD
ncbi:cysteine--tRNA ligase [Gemmobacter aquarius]|uniref:Cysteine--tRNA ligase n=1 Tax=Paragemmobacter aquarius TaxID=2169400 RepID=A0A2S0UKY5_9RHOB|nr:cysteine--tRNA ligase [Gemmobacter aquarius]AWB48462.1 cysteine--tRNA ligase [Gemmobacter aquarius]